MILIFKKFITKKPREINVAIDSFEEIQNEESINLVNFPQVFPSAVPPSCAYPLDIMSLFPRWLHKISISGDANLIELTKQYYDWLVCKSNDINSVGFLNLESINDIETMPNSYVKYSASSYLPSLHTNVINYDGYTGGHVDQNKIRLLLDNVKTNLYSRKGSKQSYDTVVDTLFGISAENINISYPKKFVMRLNSGKYDWMGIETVELGDNPIDLPAELSSSFLNFSVLPDNGLWQDYSYVVNVSGLSLEAYTNVVRPLLHPAGTADFFQIRQDIFNNNSETVRVFTSEIPKINNYYGYTMGSFSSLSSCDQGAGGDKTFVFPSWDEEISLYNSGVTFGNINIVDFTTLTPKSGMGYPNESIIAEGTCV